MSSICSLPQSKKGQSENSHQLGRIPGTDPFYYFQLGYMDVLPSFVCGRVHDMNQNKTGPTRFASDLGTTLVEVSIVIAIMTLLIAMAVPVYSSAMDIAEEQTAIADINTIADAVDSYFMNNGVLPMSLQQVGMDNSTDPWGKPYIYKPVDGADGTTATAETMNARQAARAERRAERAANKEARVSRRLLRKASALPTFVKATFSINADGYVAVDIDSDGTIDMTVRNMTIAEVQRIYIMTLKLDASDLPINLDYDLFSMGSDGDTEQRIDAPLSKDDILRAREGNFVDRADKY